MDGCALALLVFGHGIIHDGPHRSLSLSLNKLSYLPSIAPYLLFKQLFNQLLFIASLIQGAALLDRARAVRAQRKLAKRKKTA